MFGTDEANYCKDVQWSVLQLIFRQNVWYLAGVKKLFRLQFRVSESRCLHLEINVTGISFAISDSRLPHAIVILTNSTANKIY